MRDADGSLVVKELNGRDRATEAGSRSLDQDGAAAAPERGGIGGGTLFTARGAALATASAAAGAKPVPRSRVDGVFGTSGLARAPQRWRTRVNGHCFFRRGRCTRAGRLADSAWDHAAAARRRCAGATQRQRWRAGTSVDGGVRPGPSFDVIIEAEGTRGDNSWHAWPLFDTVRHGEADHPGPEDVELGLPCTWAPPGSGVTYPSPHRDGFRAIATPGFAEGVKPREEEVMHALTFETVNTTGWKGAKKRMRKSKADVLLIQETWVAAESVSAASRWALARGWKSLWTPAERTANGGLSAGTAVLVREWVGLRYPPVGGYQWHGARACAAVVDAPGYRPCLAVSAYCHHGQGPSEQNKALMADIGAHFCALGSGWSLALGADFNMEPRSLLDAGFPARLGAQVVAADNPRGTCRTRRAARNFDFFLMAGEIADVVAEVATVEASGNRTHTPVQVKLHPRAAALKALHLRPPPALPLDRVYGPLLPVPDWEETQRLMEETVRAARTRPRAEAEDILAAAYALWAYRAEGELEDATGHALPKRGTRSSRPTLVWRSVLPERRPAEGYPSEAILSWLKDLARELLRANGEGVDEEARREAIDEVERSLMRDMPTGEPCSRVSRARTALMEEVARLRAPTPCPQPPGTPVPQVQQCDDVILRQAARTQGVMDSIDADLKIQALEDGAEERRRWRDWLREDAAAGAAHAHAYSRLPEEWVPTQATDDHGIISADPSAILEGIRAAYATKWQAAQRQTRYAWREREALARLLPDELRAASLAFAKGTASTFDGLHPRHFALLSDQALAALAALYEAVELLGAWPRQLDLVVMPLLPKPKGGFRPIGLLAGAYRLWAKARRVEADRWESQNQRAYFAATAGSGPLDAVWRQAVRQEAGVAQGNEAAAVMDDLESFYELMSRSRLLKESERRGFPGPVVRACLAAYAAPRFLSLRGRISRETFPKVGIIAGCALATTFVKVYYISVYDQLAVAIPPSVEFKVFIDDTIITSEAPACKVVEDLVMARRKFHELVTEVLGGKIAEGKAGVVASTRSTASRLKWACGVEGPISNAMEYLGVDYTAGRRRGVLRKGTKREKRAQRAVLRRRRLAIIRAVIGDKARTVYTVGIAPASAYDAPIWGLTDREVLTQRRTAAVAMRPRARGRSLTITNLLHGAPSARLEVAPVLQYARAVWRAVVAREEAAARGCGLPDIGRWWEAAMSLYRDIAGTYAAVGVASKTDEKKEIAKAWRSIRGPIGGAMLSLARIGWRFSGAYKLVDDREVEITLTHTTPQLLKDLLVEGVRRSMERQVARKWASSCPLYEGRRICVDLAASALRPKAGVDPMGRGAYRASACGAIMTMHRAAQGGYDVSELCQRCKKCPDTVFHRIYGCETTEDELAKAVPQWFIQEARRADASDPFWVTGIFPHPADLAPLPETTVKIVWDNGPDDAGAEFGGAAQRFGGHVYFDGSSRQNAIRDLTRAGGAVIMADEQGRPIRRAMAAVPAHLPQTPQSAENLAFVLSVRALDMQSTVKGDCKAVVDAANAPCAAMVAARRKYGGLIMDSLRDPARRRHAGRVEWVKAHRKLTGKEDAATRRDILGNEAADGAANEARESHPPLGPEAEAWALYYTKRAPLVAKAAAAVLPLFPPAPGNLPRRPKPSSEKAAVEAAVHYWQFRAGAWRCAICAGWSREDKVVRRAGDQRCPGPRVLEQAAAFADKGHHICRTQGDLPIVFCSRCGGWAARRCHRLGMQCSAPTPAGRLALRRIEAGLHPWRRKKQGGGEEERSGVRIVAALVPGKRAWRRVGGRGPSGGADSPDAEPTESDLAKRARTSAAHEKEGGTENGVLRAVEMKPMDVDPSPVARDPEVDGTSMHMILAVLKRVPASASVLGKAAVFNGRKGSFVTTTIGSLEAERDWLRGIGVHDDDDGRRALSAAAPSAEPRHAAAATTASWVEGEATEADVRERGRLMTGSPTSTLAEPTTDAEGGKRRKVATVAALAEGTSLLPAAPGGARARGSHRPGLPRAPPRPPAGDLRREHEGPHGRRAEPLHDAAPHPLRPPPASRDKACGSAVDERSFDTPAAADGPAAANRARQRLLAALARPAEAVARSGEGAALSGAGSDVALAGCQACVNSSEEVVQAPGSDVAAAAGRACVNTRRSLPTSDPADGGHTDRAVAPLSSLRGLDGTSETDCGGPSLDTFGGDSLGYGVTPLKYNTVETREVAATGCGAAAANTPANSGTSLEPRRAVGAPPPAVAPFGTQGRRPRGGPRVLARTCTTMATAAAADSAAVHLAALSPPLADSWTGSPRKRRRICGKTTPPAVVGSLVAAHLPRPPDRASASGSPAGSTSASASADAQPAR